jgi:hypothetical protein
MMNPIRVTHEVNEWIAVRWRLPGLPWHTPFVEALTYRCAAGGRPYLHPVYAPGSGLCLTQDRPTDHPWQHGIFVGLHGVNGLDFWVEHRARPEERGEVRCVGISDLRADERTASWTALNEWRGPGGALVLEEGHTVCVHRPDAPDYYEIDFTWALTGAVPVTINRDAYGGLSVRLVYHPDHAHLNANRQTGADCAEQRAAWCDVSAPFDGSPEWTAEDLLAGAWNGVAVLDHPSNATFPTPWRVDHQGLINPSPSLLGDWRLEPGEDSVFRYRLVVHRGVGSFDQLQSRWEQFASEQDLSAFG